MGHAEVLARLLGSDRSGVAVRVFDGSRAGPADAAVVIDVRSPHALSYLATAPGDLGLARAYVTGAVEVDGDLYTALALVAGLDLDLPLRARLRLLRDLGGVRLLRRPPRPEQEVRLRGRRHSKARDQRAIAHHYDVSNRFYSWILGPSMTYTCALYQTAGATLEEAMQNAVKRVEDNVTAYKTEKSRREELAQEVEQLRSQVAAQKQPTPAAQAAYSLCKKSY